MEMMQSLLWKGVTCLLVPEETRDLRQDILANKTSLSQHHSTTAGVENKVEIWAMDPVRARESKFYYKQVSIWPSLPTYTLPQMIYKQTKSQIAPRGFFQANIDRSNKE